MQNFRPVSPHLSVYSPQNSSSFSILFRISGIFLSFFVLSISYFSIFFPFLFFAVPLIYPFFYLLAFFLLAFLILHSLGLSSPQF